MKRECDIITIPGQQEQRAVVTKNNYTKPPLVVLKFEFRGLRFPIFPTLLFACTLVVCSQWYAYTHIVIGKDVVYDDSSTPAAAAAALYQNVAARSIGETQRGTRKVLKEDDTDNGAAAATTTMAHGWRREAPPIAAAADSHYLVAQDAVRRFHQGSAGEMEYWKLAHQQGGLEQSSLRGGAGRAGGTTAKMKKAVPNKIQRLPMVQTRQAAPSVAVQGCAQAWQNYTFPSNNECRVNPRSNRPHCQFYNLQLNTSKVFGQRLGGEELSKVIGQSEEAEQVSYYQGAWMLNNDSALFDSPPSQDEFYYINKVLESMSQMGTDKEATCDHSWEGTTLFIERYEYANLYHANSDWWNAYWSSPTGSRDSENTSQALHFIFLDAHPASNLDSVWKRLLGVSELHWIRRLLPGIHCFRNARFIPAGYSASIMPKYRSRCPSPSMSSSYVDSFLKAHDILDDSMDEKRRWGHVVVLERKSYLAHARSKVHVRPERALGNLALFASKIPTDIPEYNNWTIEKTTLVKQSMAEQLSTIRRAHFVIANHGAGLTHLLFASPGSHILELSCPDFTFYDLASWRPDIHHYCLGPPPGDITTEYWESQVLSILRDVIQNRTVQLEKLVTSQF